VFKALDRSERMQLMKFLCSFAWADLTVRPEERRFVSRMVGKLELDEEERRRVAGWLKVPPGPESIDPTRIPREHRRVFLKAIEGVIRSDGEVAPEEQENFELLKELLASP
jgi:Tellurite resistance protein TerB